MAIGVTVSSNILVGDRTKMHRRVVISFLLLSLCTILSAQSKRIKVEPKQVVFQEKALMVQPKASVDQLDVVDSKQIVTPKVKAPSKPEIDESQLETPEDTTNERYVYLLHADETRFNQRINPDAQILVGNVAFRHDSMYMYCDSALFYEANNSLDAYGNVRMNQGDTLFLYGDRLHYKGDEMLAKVRENVVMIDKEMKLTTDSLNYDRTINLGY